MEMVTIFNRRSAGLFLTALLLASTVSPFQQLSYASGQRTIDANEAASPSGVAPLQAKSFDYNDDEYRNQSAQKAYSVGARRSSNNDLVLRFEVRAGERAYFDRKDRDRSEATSLARFPKDEVIWNAYRVKIADGFPIPDGKKSWFIVGQWHGSKDDKRSPYIAAEVQGKDLVFLRRYVSNGKPISREMYRMKDVPRGKWLNIAIEHKVSSTDGLLNIWLNGRQVVNFDGPVGYWDHDEAGYWKFGIYRSRNDTNAVVEYRDVVTTTENLSQRATMTN
jgi:Polysaccharide lyase